MVYSLLASLGGNFLSHAFSAFERSNLGKAISEEVESFFSGSSQRGAAQKLVLTEQLLADIAHEHISNCPWTCDSDTDPDGFKWYTLSAEGYFSPEDAKAAVEIAIAAFSELFDFGDTHKRHLFVSAFASNGLAFAADTCGDGTAEVIR